VKNIHLNTGGVIGAILILTAVCVVVALTSSSNDIGGRVGGFGVVGVFVGGFGGNYLWERWFPKSK